MRRKKTTAAAVALCFCLLAAGCGKAAATETTAPDFIPISSFTVYSESMGTSQGNSYVSIRYTDAEVISAEEMEALGETVPCVDTYRLEEFMSESGSDSSADIFSRTQDNTLRPKYVAGDICIVREIDYRYGIGICYYKATITEVKAYLYSAKILSSGSVWIQDYEGNITYYSADYIEIVYFGAAEDA